MSHPPNDNHSVPERLLARYLQNRGWAVQNLRDRFQRISIADDGKDPIEVFLNYSSSHAQRDVGFALATVSQYYERSIEDLAAEIRSLAYDTIRSKIPDEYIFNDAIELKIATDYLQKMRNLLAATASTELTNQRHIRRLRKEGIEFAENCRFGHTFRGSFGFQVESPVGLNDQPALSSEHEQYPLGRRVVNRLAHGFQAIQTAHELGSVEAITFEDASLSSNMCDAMADMIEDVGVSKISFEIRFSSEWSSSAISHQFILTRSHLPTLDRASSSLRAEDDSPKIVSIIGRIKRLETSGNPADLFDLTSGRTIEVIWLSEQDAPISVRASLSPQQYIEAVDAHRQGDHVRLQGTLARDGRRSLRLEDITDFGVI